MRSHFRIVLLSSLVFASPARADDPTPVGATAPTDPVFRALRLDGSTASGRIRELGPGGRVVLVDGGERVAIPLDELVKLTREGDPPPAPVEGTQALFPEGDRLKGAIGSGGEAGLEVTAPALGEATLTVPLDGLLGVVLTPPASPEATVALLEKVRGEGRDADVLWMVNPDRRSGSILELTAQKVIFQADAGPLPIDRSDVAALGFDPKLAKYPRPEGTFLELTLADGSRLGVVGARVERGRILADTRFGAPIQVALGDLSRVHVRGDRVAYLSERKESAVQYEGYVGPPRPFRRDASVEGRPLRLGGQPYDRGLGTQSRTLLAYKLEPGDRRFQALVGLDDRAGPLGSVIFRVKVDGKDAFASPPMSARDTPGAIDVDVSGAKLLILMTEFGERGEVRDVADWVEARLIR